MGELNYASWGWRLAFALVIPPSIFATSGLRSDSNANADSNVDSNPSQACGHGDEVTSILGTQRSDGAEHFFTVKNHAGATGGGETIDWEGPSGHLFQDEPTLHSVLPSNGNSLIPNQPNRRKTMHVPLWLLITLSIYVQFAISSYNNLNIYMVQYSRESIRLLPR